MASVEEERSAELDAEAHARRQLAFAQIRQYADPVLRMRAHEVEVFDDDLARLADRMMRLLHDANGAGLAANQVGVLRRVFVFQNGEEVMALVNPRIVGESDEREVDTEGCLSLASVRVPVERALGVSVEARDPAGADVRLELEGFPARVVQHEVDHLDGVLMLDRTEPASRRAALAELRPRAVISSRG
ncbi:MAG: peptide deformylase [Actinomycetota bacterium]|nr:peptide deformylase [Actinomycetota bacterium]